MSDAQETTMTQARDHLHLQETDFWKHESIRKTWDSIIPGVPRKTLTHTLTQSEIHKLCHAINEHHPIYWDDNYAKKYGYPGMIAPPHIHILLMFTCTPIDDFMRSPGTINAGQSWTYNIPARAGDTIKLQARALDKFIRNQRLFVVHDNVFFNQNGDVICAGRGHTIRPI